MKLSEITAKIVVRGELRKYYRVVRADRWYGGIATADCCGCNLRCVFCLPQDTSVLMRDFSWKRINDVKVGDEVIGVGLPNVKYRQIRLAEDKVVEKLSRQAFVYEVVTDCGSIKLTKEHPMLSSHRRWLALNPKEVSEVHAYKLRKGAYVKFVSEVVNKDVDANYMLGYIHGLTVGDGSIGCSHRRYPFLRIAMKDLEPIEFVKKALMETGIARERDIYIHLYSSKGHTYSALYVYKKNVINNIMDIRFRKEESFLRGFLAGVYDAEGSFSKILRIANSDDETIKKIEMALDKLGFKHKTEKSKRKTNYVRLIGGFPEKIRFFSSVMPKIDRKKTDLLHRALRTKWAEVIEIKPVGITKVYNLVTARTHTFIANGFIVHNCWSGLPRDRPGEVGKFYGPREIFNKLNECASRRNFSQVRISGNEPTIGKEHLLKVLEKFDGTNLTFILETNGILIGNDKNYARDLSRYRCVHVRVSIKGSNPEEFSKLTGSIPEGFNLQINALKNLLDAGVSCHPAAMLSFSTKESIKKLLGKLAEIDPILVKEFEDEYVFLYPHVVKRLRKAGIKPITAYSPNKIPQNLI